LLKDHVTFSTFKVSNICRRDSLLKWHIKVTLGMLARFILHRHFWDKLGLRNVMYNLSFLQLKKEIGFFIFVVVVVVITVSHRFSAAVTWTEVPASEAEASPHRNLRHLDQRIIIYYDFNVLIKLCDTIKR